MSRTPRPPDGADRDRRDRSPRASTRDRGAALVVTVAFVIMIGTILAGLTPMVTSGLETRVALERIRDRQYAADGAVEQAIAESRRLVDLAALGCDDDSSTTATVAGLGIRVDRSTSCGAAVGADGLPVTQLRAVFAACEDTGDPCADDAVIVRALVGFETGGDGVVEHVAVHSWSVDR